MNSACTIIPTKDTTNTCSFAVYGTLRDDNDTTAPWTKKFIDGHTTAQTATIYGYKMYHKRQKASDWPYALKTNSANDFITVRVIAFQDTMFPKKLEYADEIENHDPHCPERCEYQRDIVSAIVINPTDNDNITTVTAIMYYVTKLDESCQFFPVSSGNWLERDRNFID